MTKKIRWGVLSTAKIGVEKVIPAMQRGQLGEVTAIASQSLDKAQAAARKLNIPKAYGSYEALLADRDIDAIYNPLPNHLHVPWSIKAIEAGKHVLCEKPIGLSAAEGRQLVEAAQRHPQLKLMEAFMYRHHPQWQKAKQLTTSGAIGTLRTIHTFFSYHNDNPANIRNMRDIGGGGLMDIGCYPISLSRFLFQAEPKRVFGIVEYDPNFQTDRLVSAILDFGHGTATFSCATQLTPYQQVNIYGTEGRVQIDIPFNAPPDRPCILWHQRGAETTKLTVDICDQYTIQGDLFAAAIRNDTPVPTPIEDAVRNMEVIEAVVQSSDRGSWVLVKG